jgi:hypothetical protein
MRKLFGTLLLLLLSLALASQPPQAPACATVQGEGKSVRIASESALIVWDEKTKTQHFIRRASFQTRVPYFGFLVPTPTLPELAETPDSVFQSLEDWSKAEEKTVWQPAPMISISCAEPPGADKSAKGPAVEEFGRQRVAGFDAVKLKATDIKALRNWLEEHGYDARPQLMDWVGPYVKQGWFITAFQIAKTDAEEDRLSTQAVRMSFTTKRPIFPYREPSDAGKDSGRGGRLLRLFVVAGQRLQGELDNGKEWPVDAAWANPLTAKQHETLADRIGSREVTLPDKAWLTVFDDASAPRLGDTDLVFTPAGEQAALKRPAIIHIKTYYSPSPCDLSCMLVLAVPIGLLFLAVFRAWRRSRTAG